MAGMERDPQDGKVAFVEVKDSFEVNTIEDAFMVLQGLHKAAVMLFDQYGHVMYPIFKTGS